MSRRALLINAQRADFAPERAGAKEEVEHAIDGDKAIRISNRLGTDQESVAIERLGGIEPEQPQGATLRRVPRPSDSLSFG